jgi:hypothetical protein
LIKIVGIHDEKAREASASLRAHAVELTDLEAGPDELGS